MMLALDACRAASLDRPRRGRPRTEMDPEQRSLHLEVAKARLLYSRPVAEIMKAFDISRRTVSLWTEKALGYDGPIAAACRRASAELN